MSIFLLRKRQGKGQKKAPKEPMRILLVLLFLSSCIFFNSNKNLDSDELYLNKDIKVEVYKRDSAYEISKDSKIKANLNSQLFKIYKLDLEEVSSFEVSTKSKNFFIADKNSNLYWYRKVNDKFLKRTLLKGNSPISAISLSPDESKLVVAQFSSASIFDLSTMKIIAKQKKIKGRIKSVAWGNNSEQIAFGMLSGGVFVWRLDKDVENSLEIYESESTSPIVGITFLPSSEAMFTASRQGEIKIWRLIKTEQELGFYDPNAVIDQSNKVSYSKEVAVLDKQLENIWLDTNNLYVSSSEGSVYSWKLRGLKFRGEIKADLKGVLSSGSINADLFFTTGREQNLKIWCVNSISEDITLESQAVYRSGIFESTLNLAKISNGQLWAYEKTGNLISLDFNKLNLNNSCNAQS